MSAVGIMQGRLSVPVDGRIQAFPRDAWRNEFEAAALAGMDFIEWIYDAYGSDVNPIGQPAGIAELKALQDRHGIPLRSVCADYFMEYPLLKCSLPERQERIAVLAQLFDWSRSLDVKYIVLPFVDSSRIDNEDEANDFVTLMIQSILPLAEKYGIEAHLETSLAPNDVASVLDRIPHPLFWINYDSGNSSSLGYRPDVEFDAYGARIGSFHIKDRICGGTTVPLGTGDADFGALNRCLARTNYQRAFVLQVARGETGKEIELARHNKAYAFDHIIPAEGATWNSA